MNSIEQSIANRYLHKREIGIPTDRRGDIDAIESEIESGMAEKYACEFFGQPFDSAVYDAGDCGWDFLIGELTADAKWLGMCKNGRPRQSGRVIVDVGKLRADLYVAVSGSRNTGFHLVGWCTSDELVYSPWFVTKYPDKRGRNYRYAIHTADMHSIEALKEME